jgi:hypothetical protein
VLRLRREVSRQVAASAKNGGDDGGGKGAGKGAIVRSSIDSVGLEDLNGSVGVSLLAMSPQQRSFAAVGAAVARAAAAGTISAAVLEGLERSGVDLNASVASLGIGGGGGLLGSVAIESSRGDSASPTRQSPTRRGGGGNGVNPLPMVDPAADASMNSLSVTDWGAMTVSLNRQQQRGHDVGMSPATALGAAVKDFDDASNAAAAAAAASTASASDAITPRTGAAPRPTTSVSPAASPSSGSRKPTHAAMSGWRSRRRSTNTSAAVAKDGASGSVNRPSVAKNNASALDEYIQTHEGNRE